MESANKRSDQAETGESGQGKSRDDLTLLIRRLGDMREEMLRFAEKCPGALSEAIHSTKRARRISYIIWP